MSVAVLVPYRPDGGRREEAWEAIQRLWSETFSGWEVRLGVLPAGEPWCKGAAAAAAIEGCDADVLVVADADVWCEPGDEVARAVALVMARRRQWVVPHHMVVRLSAAGSDGWLAGERAGLELDQAPYRGIAGGGLFVISRAGWDRLGGFDRRFVGWGQEDIAFGRAAEVLVGRHHRGRGQLWHLWHPPQDRRDRIVGSTAGQQLLAEYRRAGRNPERMAEVVAGGRELDRTARWDGRAAARPGQAAGPGR